MKNLVKKALLVISCLMLTLFTLTGCASAEGTYKFDSLKYEENGATVEVKVGETFMGMITLTEDYMTLEIKGDGTFTMTASGQSAEGTWEKDGSTIELTAEGQTMEATLSGKTITMEMSGSTLVLKK